MKALTLRLLVVAALGCLLSGCHGDLVTKDVPGYPVFKASEEAIDFGRVALQDVAEATVTLRNIGSNDSELYLYYYLEGDGAFRFVFPNHEFKLRPADDPKFIDIRFIPERPGEAQANLVVYYSTVPLSEDINVSTYKIPLSGCGTGTCDYPQNERPDHVHRLNPDIVPLPER